MSDPTDPLAVSFANSRPSQRHEKLTDLRAFVGWAAEWPALATVAKKLRAADLEAIRVQRDATQRVLRSLAVHEKPEREAFAASVGTALDAAPFDLRSGPSGVTVTSADPAAAVSHILGRATVDLLVSPEGRQLQRCENPYCSKVFVANRANRRWCDTRICGNRARVAAHARRQSAKRTAAAAQA